MERSSTFSTPEIVGIATAAAAALGGVIVALGRAQDNSARGRLIRRNGRRDSRRERLERGRELALAATSTLASRYPEVRMSASDWMQRATESARPQVSRASSTAASTADQLRVTGASMLARLQESVLPAAQGAIADLRERAVDVADQAQPTTRKVVATTTTKADVAVTKTTSAAQEALAAVLWLVAACVVIYFALLDEERRERVKNFLYAAVDQTQLLMRDFEGYEEEM